MLLRRSSIVRDWFAMGCFRNHFHNEVAPNALRAAAFAGLKGHDMSCPYILYLLEVFMFSDLINFPYQLPPALQLLPYCRASKFIPGRGLHDIPQSLFNNPK